MTGKIDPIRPTDDDARALAQTLLSTVGHGALGVIDPISHSPLVTKVAFGWLDAPHLLISDLSMHTAALMENPACSLLVAADGNKGDPLTYPRITLQCLAETIDKTPLRDAWLTRHPKSKLYFDFTDFRMVRLNITDAYLNGGFGKAFKLTAADLN